MTKVLAYGNSRRRMVWAVAIATALIAGLLTVAVREAIPAAASHDKVACSPDGDWPAGYECTPLYNKGNPGDPLGELYFKFTGTTIEMKVNTFVSNKELSGAKLCLDDDDAELTARTSCVGDKAGTSISSSGYTLAAAGNPPEESSGKWEYMLEKNALSPSECKVEGAACSAEIGGYTFFSFHFNQSSYSIESFFEREPGIPLPCGNHDTTFTSTGDPTVTVRVEGDECVDEKRINFDAGVTTEDQFVLMSPADDFQPKVLFLIDVDWVAYSGGSVPLTVQYNDVPPYDEDDLRVLPYCVNSPLSSPGTFDLDDGLTIGADGNVYTTDGDPILPSGATPPHTSCLVESHEEVIGGLVHVSSRVFNVGDGLLSFR